MDTVSSLICLALGLAASPLDESVLGGCSFPTNGWSRVRPRDRLHGEYPHHPVPEWPAARGASVGGTEGDSDAPT